MAYTKYSLTPSNNNAAPPDGAPEGMLPSAVNDTMRDMMSQIRDCGDGIRGGTYTMTAPVITGGSISGSTMSSNVITGGSINNTPIGASTASTGAFSTLSASSTVSGTGFSNYFASPPALGGTAAAAVSSTNLAYTGTLTGGTGVVNLGSGQVYKDASGNIGINTTNPTAITNFRSITTNGTTGVLLDAQVGGTIASRLDSRSGEVALNSYGTLAFGTGSGGSSTERMRIDSSGNVGIGVTSMSQKAVVGGSANTRIQVDGSSSGGIYFTQAGSDAGTISGTTSRMAFFAGGYGEAMRIDSSGNLLVGTTTSDAKVTITTSAIDGLRINAAGNGGYIYSTSTTIGNAGYFTTSSGLAGYIQCNGTTTSYATSSDYRLKENIAPMTGALNTVAKLKPVTYTWKADGSDGQGFIAHELQEVVPDCVTGKKDAMRTETYVITPFVPAEVDEDGKIIKEAVEAVMGQREVPDYQGIDTSFLLATLTAAIQEQQVMIEELKAKVAALEAA